MKKKLKIDTKSKIKITLWKNENETKIKSSWTKTAIQKVFFAIK